MKARIALLLAAALLLIPAALNAGSVSWKDEGGKLTVFINYEGPVEIHLNGAAVQPGQQPAPTQPPTGPQPPDKCPTSQEDAAQIGGKPEFWKVLPGTNGLGWKFEADKAYELRAPHFGKLDHPAGTARRGELVNTQFATFWCEG